VVATTVELNNEDTRPQCDAASRTSMVESPASRLKRHQHRPLIAFIAIEAERAVFRHA